jgi:cytochrome c2
MCDPSPGAGWLLGNTMKLHGLMLAGAMLAMAANAHADGDPLKGEEFFRARCTSCHALERNVSKVGPSLLGVIDQSPASLRSSSTIPKR